MTTSDNTPHSPWRAVAFLLLLGIAWRTLLGSASPLFPDETYYWEWSRRLATGYFDHPPAIAWLIALGTAVFGDTVAGVRAGAALCGVVVHASAVALAYRLGGEDSAVRAAIVALILPIATLGLVLATPDAPLFAAAMLCLVALERALASEPRSKAATLWWCIAGVALGLAFVSKYTAVLLPAALFVACVLHPALRARFSEPGPWLATIIAAAIFAPVIMWNAANDWVSFRFQLGHGLGTGAKGTILTRELELIGGQLGLATPILGVLMAVAVWRALRSGWTRRQATVATDIHARTFALGVMALFPLLFFAVSATRKAVEANWPALIYPAALTLLVIAVGVRVPPPMRSRSTGEGIPFRWFRYGTALALVLMFVLTAQVFSPILPLAPRKDPMARAYGWDQLAAVVDSMRRDSFFGDAEPRVAAERYQETSQLAFHLPDHPDVYSLNLGGRPNQYDRWHTTRQHFAPGDAMIAVFDANPDGDERAARMSQQFSEVREGPVVALRRGQGEVAHRKVWLMRGAR